MTRPRRYFKIPRTLILHKQKIRVRIVPDLQDAEDDPDPIAGLYIRRRREILLEQYQSIEQLERTLVHEALHAAMPPRFSAAEEERLVRQLELPVYRLVLALVRSCRRQRKRWPAE